MEHCVGCGHALGQSLYCTQCGRPCDRDDWRTGTAERPVVPPLAEPAPPRPTPPPTSPPTSPPRPRPPSLPPPVVAAPPAARYPLYADEAVGLLGPATASALPVPPVPPVPTRSPAPPAAPAVTAPAPPPAARPSGRRVLPWAVGVIIVLLMGLVGTLLLLDPGDDDRADDPTTPSASSPSVASEAPTDVPGTDRPDPRDTPADPSRGRRPAEVTRSLTVEVPETAAPNQDVSGNLVRYEATNLIDGVPETCWRMPGAATGEEIVLRLAAPTRVSRVGLVNGYAKTSGDLDWYAGNRRVLAVEWVFDDGSTVAQSLRETRSLQTRAIRPVRTTTIRLRLVEVSAPGGGRAARDYTAISDLSVTGTPL